MNKEICKHEWRYVNIEVDNQYFDRTIYKLIFYCIYCLNIMEKGYSKLVKEN